ncbi:MAG TPA: metallophosphoesterase [Candidatus Polarisedimenticolia bacterium]|nr:metallophosphoesterase [Candidatus Polarisedimenticolia bacterium]
MAALRFLQLSDLHLDSSLQSGRLALPAEKARTRRAELRQIVPRAADLARQRGVELVLIAGDLFDDEAITQDTINFVIDHLAAMAPIPVVIAPGNHDFYSLGSPYNDDLLAARKQRLWPGNVHIFRDGAWSTHSPARLPAVRITGMAHAANAALTDRLLARPLPRPPASEETLDLLILHGSRDHARIPSGKLRTLPFSDAELAAQGFDYAAVGHYHDHALIHDPSGKIAGAYAGCPAGRGLDEEGERHVLLGEIVKEKGAARVSLEKVRLDRRAVRSIEVSCTGATHRDAILRRVEDALALRGAEAGDLIHLRLTGRVAPGIDPRPPEGAFDERFFHLAVDASRLKPDYDVERYRDESLRTTEARFAREMLRRIEAEDDHARRRLLENALYYGLDALIQKDVAPRYED